MSAPIVKLFTRPNFAWTDIRREEEAHPDTTSRTC